ncbi:MAG TPA: hypothetical protein VIM76_06095 [Candidatus Dormibacteraeota bacterium]
MSTDDAERSRLGEDRAAWLRWGPYLSERAWGTVREDYSERRCLEPPSPRPRSVAGIPLE